MLASSYQWSADKTSIVFTMRQNVKWNDGQPFTADDVAYTFDTMKRVPATDLYSLWTGAGLRSVTAAGDKVTMTFDQAAGPYFFNFANQVGIVPKHIFSTGPAAAAPGHLGRPGAGRHRPVQGGPVQREQHPVRGERRLLAGRASRTWRRSSTRRPWTTGRRTSTWAAARPSGAASSSRTSRRSISTSPRTTTPGPRRSRTSRSSPTSTRPTRRPASCPYGRRSASRSTGRRSR
jgi:ABC-type dipeptide transport system, periplasmic component